MPTTFNSPIYAEQNEARTNPSRLASPNVASGDVQFAEFAYTIDGDEVADDVINLCLLPAGAIPMPMLSKVYSASPGTELVMDIGNANNPDGFADDISLTGGPVMFTSGTAPAWVAPTPIVADSNSGNAAIFATIGVADTLTPGVVLYFQIAWKLAR